MSGLDAMFASLRAIEGTAEDSARDVADLFGGRMRSGKAEASGEQITLRPGFLSDAWSEDMAEQIQKTMGQELEGSKR